MSELEKCFHCGDYLGPRQLYRHLRIYQEQLELRLSQMGMNDEEGDEEGDIEGGGAENAGGGAGMEHIGVNDITEPAVDTDIEMSGYNVDNHSEPELLQPAFGLRRNPPVTIEDWPDPEADPDFSDDEENAFAQFPNDPEGDPEFVERQEPLQVHPDDEPEYTNEEIRQRLVEVLGDFADEEWVRMYIAELEARDYTTLQFLATRLRTHFSRQTYEDLRHGAFEELGIPSEFVAWRRLRVLSGLETRAYDCCVKSCCCFLGKYQDLDRCPFCNENRYAANGSARRVFRYSPLIPQLQALYLNPQSASNLLYQSLVEKMYDPNVVADVFDGVNYRSLRETLLSPDSNYRIFDHRNDLALGLSTDGFTLFKRRRRGHSTAWPIIIINYNLHPKIRTRLENVLCVGVIPGPTQCKDLNSFLIPLLDELLQLSAVIYNSPQVPLPGWGYPDNFSIPLLAPPPYQVPAVSREFLQVQEFPHSLPAGIPGTARMRVHKNARIHGSRCHWVILIETPSLILGECTNYPMFIQTI